MKLDDWIIWICFTFCLALLIGGILLLFRHRKRSKNTGLDYLQYYVVPIYTYGFYALWSRVFIGKIPFFTHYPNIEFIKEVISVMGSPFLILGVILQLIWVYRSVNKSPLVKIGISLLPVLLIITSVILFPQQWNIDGPDLSRPLSLIIISIGIASSLMMLFARSSILSLKVKNILSFLILLSVLVHLGNFFSISSHSLYLPIYIFGFFLFNTLAEALFIYSVKIVEPVDINSFDEFISKFEITKRESEIIQEIYRGKSNQEIADSQFVTLQTVKDHTSRIYQKTQVRSRSQLIAALRNYL